MANQKIFGLIVTDQKIPIIEKPIAKEQCYLCGFTFNNEDCLLMFSDESLEDKRKAHTKCIQSHLRLLPKDTKIALVNESTNEVMTYTSVAENA
ncbi:MAG: hypothetical protein JXA54_00545 [Candidatus Heimdallarchaeota archaeon]|nr:hypothetical protein [Candidatus Heimdallarchaeota archaeon]